MNRSFAAACARHPVPTRSAEPRRTRDAATREPVPPALRRLFPNSVAGPFRAAALLVLLACSLAGSPAEAQPPTTAAGDYQRAGSTSHAANPAAHPPAAPAADFPPNLPPIAADRPIPTKNLLQVIRDGGPLMIPIGLCSFVLLVFAFERSISLRYGRVIPRPFVKRFLQQLRDGELDRESALELCEKNRSPAAEIFAAAIRKWGRPSVEVEQAIIDAGERVTNNLRKYLRVLNGVSTVSPLLGLLGTVLGMISAFNAIATADAMGRPELLASGISQALITTAAGLSVAIPALILYLYFTGRVDQLIVTLDALGQKVVGMIASDMPAARGGEAERGKAERSERRRPAA